MRLWNLLIMNSYICDYGSQVVTRFSDTYIYTWNVILFISNFKDFILIIIRCYSHAKHHYCDFLHTDFLAQRMLFLITARKKRRGKNVEKEANHYVKLSTIYNAQRKNEDYFSCIVIYLLYKYLDFYICVHFWRILVFLKIFLRLKQQIGKCNNIKI